VPLLIDWARTPMPALNTSKRHRRIP